MRYFLEVSYKGTKYAGFQVQQNAPTIQSAVEKALSTLYQIPFALTVPLTLDNGAMMRFYLRVTFGK